MANMLIRVLKALSRKEASAQAVECSGPPIPVQRDFVLDSSSRVRVGEVAAKRIAQHSRGDFNPLQLYLDKEYVEGGRSSERVALVATAYLQGLAKVPADQRRCPLHPVTQEMLTLAGCDPDAFAAIAALHIYSGLYIDDISGRTLAKAIFDDAKRDPDEIPHVRVRVHGEGTRPPLVWWQDSSGGAMLGVPELPATAAESLIGRMLSDVIDDPAPGKHALMVVSVLQDDSIDFLGRATLIKLHEKNDGSLLAQ